MILEKRIEDIFNTISNLPIDSIYKYNILLDISEPLLFSFNDSNDYYLVYVMQNRTVMLDNNKADIIELLIVNTTLLEINNLLSGLKTIKDCFIPLDNKSLYRFGKVSNKIFPKIKVNAIEEVEDRIPLDGVFLNDLPNKINIKKLLENHN